MKAVSWDLFYLFFLPLSGRYRSKIPVLQTLAIAIRGKVCGHQTCESPQHVAEDVQQGQEQLG